MTSQPIRAWAAAGFLAGALVLCGCGSGDDDAAPAPAKTAAAAQGTATPADTTALPASMVGHWKRLMRPRDWKSAGSGYPLGIYRLDVAHDGKVGVYFPRKDAVDFEPAFLVDGDNVTVDSIPLCPGVTINYAWHATAHEMTLDFTDGGEGCSGAVALFNGTWRR